MQFRLGNVDAFQLADALQYMHAHLGFRTQEYIGINIELRWYWDMWNKRQIGGLILLSTTERV